MFVLLKMLWGWCFGGSRGACLCINLIQIALTVWCASTPITDMKVIANRIATSDFQLNTHAIGDSANTVM
jgi:hypothetical protein